MLREVLEEAGRSEEIRKLPWCGPSVPSPLRHVLKAVEASMNAVDREEEAVVAMLQLLRQPLEDPQAVDLLLSLLSSRSFLVLGDPRVDALLGPKSPLVLRRWVLETVAP